MSLSHENLCLPQAKPVTLTTARGRVAVDVRRELHLLDARLGR